MKTKKMCPLNSEREPMKPSIDTGTVPIPTFLPI
jgi:hypothetical protein